jgi:tetratricopeptide (TPR) repeat protein
VRLWDAATGQLVRELSAGDKSRAHSVAFSPTDPRLLAVGYGGQADVSYVALWDLDAGTELARLTGATDLPDFKVDEYTGVVGALAFSPDGKYLVAGFGSKQLFSPASAPYPLKVWEVATRRLLRRLDGHTGYCVSLDFSRDGKLLACGSRDGTAILWSTETWKATHTLQNPEKESQLGKGGPGLVEDVAFAPDGKTLALASREGSVQLWDVATGKLLETLRGHSSAVSAVVFSPDGRTLASGGSDQTVRLWNVATRRQLLQLDTGNVELGGVMSLAFSPDGEQLLAAGRTGAAFWSAAPVVWDDADRAAAKLRPLLHSNASFPSRIRLLSENLRLHEALAKLDANDGRVQAARAATQASSAASRKEWPEAVLAFDRLRTADPTSPEAWLRTPGLLRLATALLHQNRPADAARLLQGGAKRRTEDGIPAIAKVMRFGFKFVVEDGAVRLTGLEDHSPASSSSLLPGDVLVKVNDVAMTKETIPHFETMLAGDVVTRLRLTVRHPGATPTEDVTLVKGAYRVDDATGELFVPLLAALDKRLAENPKDAGLLELRAELNRQETDFARQVADYTAVIQILTEQPAEAGSARLRQLYRHRGDAYVGLHQWAEAIDDYAQLITPETTDALLLANRARAHEALEHWEAAAADWSRAATGNLAGAALLAEFARRLAAGGQAPLAKAPFEKAQVLLEQLLRADPESDLVAAKLAQVLLDKQENGQWTVLEPTEMKSEGGATLTRQSDGSILATGKNPDRDLYTLVARPALARITAIRLEVLPDPSLPKNGPGRYPNGNFHLSKMCVLSGGKPATLTDIRVTAAENQDFRHLLDGRIAKTQGWGTWNREGEKHTAFIATDFQRAPDDDLKIELYFARAYSLQHNLGRFRLSVRSDAGAFEREEAGLKVAIDPWLKLAAAYAVNGRNEEALQFFGTALERATVSGAWQPVFALAARSDDLLAALIKRQPDEPPLQLDLARKLAERGKQRLAAMQPAPARVEFEKARGIYAQLLAKYPKPQWTVLTPTEMKAESGASMEMQKDGSVFVQQSKSAKNDIYALTFQSELKGIKGLRLETLADSRLPGGGPGWAIDGNFVLNELTLQTAPAGSPGEGRAIALRNAAADYSAGGADVRYAVDGNKVNLGWSVVHEASKDHTAVFELAEEVGDGQASRLTVRLSNQSNMNNNLGRFRLSFTNEAATLQATRVWLDLKDSELVDLYVALGKACAQQGRTNEAVASFTEALTLAADRAGKARILAEAGPLAGVLEPLVPHQPNPPPKTANDKK